MAISAQALNNKLAHKFTDEFVKGHNYIYIYLFCILTYINEVHSKFLHFQITSDSFKFCMCSPSFLLVQFLVGIAESYKSTYAYACAGLAAME